MELMEAIKRRSSIRNYQNREIEQEKLNLLLEAARLAPSASNRQEWRFIVAKEFSTRQKLMAAAKGQHFVGEAAVVLACCAETDNHIMACGQPCYPIDVAIAIDHITLKAIEEGLGTCWVGAFDENEVKKVLDIPENIRVVELLTIGYPQQVYEVGKNRLDLNEIVMYEKWEK